MTIQRKQAHCHRDIAEVAKEAAANLYEVVMGDDLVRSEWKRQHPGANEKVLLQAFISKNWPQCLDLARATLAQLLRGPLDAEAKERIMEVLTLDATLMRGRGRAPTICQLPRMD